MVCRLAPSFAAHELVNTARVLTTASFAVKPVISAVEPAGRKNPGE